MSTTTSIPHRFSTLALGAGLLLASLGTAQAQDQMSTPARPVPLPTVLPLPAASLPTPTILIPGQTAGGAKLADTIVYQGTIQSGDFCSVTRTEQRRTPSAVSATASATVSVTVVCDVTLTTTP